MIILKPEPLGKENFLPYGHVIEAGKRSTNHMNSGTFQRFDDLAVIDALPVDTEAEQSERAHLSIVRSQVPTPLPHKFDLIECHPLCSQAFVPLSEFVFVVVVGKSGDSIDASNLRAFVTNGRQGISYLPGTWHMPLISQQPGQEFLVVDQAARPGNLRERKLPEHVTLESPALSRPEVR